MANRSLVRTLPAMLPRAAMTGPWNACGFPALSLPVGNLASFIAGDRLELGLSGEWGPQDNATDTAGDTKFAGVDLQYLGTSFWLKAQAMRAGSKSSAFAAKYA